MIEVELESLWRDRKNLLELKSGFAEVEVFEVGVVDGRWRWKEEEEEERKRGLKYLVRLKWARTC